MFYVSVKAYAYDKRDWLCFGYIWVCEGGGRQEAVVAPPEPVSRTTALHYDDCFIIS